MKSLIMALGVIVTGFFLACTPVQAGQALNEALGSPCRNNVCTVSDNPGGDIAVFQAAAQEAVAENKILVVDGKCASACVILADLLRPNNVCITQNAQMLVHQASVITVTGFANVDGKRVPVGNLIRKENPPQSADIDQWVKSHGGYPTEGVRLIPLSAANQFWGMCTYKK